MAMQCRTYLCVEFHQALRCADVHPQALVMFAADLAEGDLCAQQRSQRRDAAARDAGEQAGLIEADAAEGESGCAVCNALLMQTEVAVGMLWWVACQHQMHGIAVGDDPGSSIMQVGKIIIAEYIAVDHGERLVTQ